MQALYYALTVLAAIVAVLFSLLIFFTGKGDAMSGGSTAVRTSFKGKASFDDQISKLTMILGGAFMALMLILDVLLAKIY